MIESLNADSLTSLAATIKESITRLRSSSSPTARSARSSDRPLGLPRELAYLTTGRPENDTVAALLASLGCQVIPCTPNELRSHGVALVNCTARGAHDGDGALQETWHNKIVGLVAGQSDSRAVRVPCSFGQFRGLLEHLGRQQRESSRIASGSPLVVHDTPDVRASEATV